MKNFLKKIFNIQSEKQPREAYELWAENYDDESAAANKSGNLMLHFDKILFYEFLSKVDLSGKIILDFGCGTGRYWGDILKNHRKAGSRLRDNPKKLIGCDISQAMISKLKEKFPSSETHILKNNKLHFLDNNSVDFIISTLVIAHIKNIKEVIKEWSRILKAGGGIFITDFHPIALEKGAKRTFQKNEKTVTIKNFIHPLRELEGILSSFDFKLLNKNEKIIDESIKEFYEKKNALRIYEEYKNTPMIYSLRFVKSINPQK